MSEIEESVYEVIKSAFPNFKVHRQYYIKLEGQRLFFDFFIKELNILIEVQGQQHYKFSKFYHGSLRGFYNSKKRDNMKKYWAAENGYCLVILDDSNLPKTAHELIDLLYKARCDL